MTVSLKTLLRYLPLDDKVRVKTLEKMDNYSPDQRLALSKVCWSDFYQLIDSEVQQEFEKALLDIKEGKREMQADLYQNIENQIYQKFMRDIRDQQETDTLDNLRIDLKKMIKQKTKKTVSVKHD